MKTRKRLAAIAAAVCLFVGGGVVVAGPAAAGNCTVIGPIKLCGKVTNYSSSKCKVQISNGWPHTTGTIKTLLPGQVSTRFYADTDAIKIPIYGCSTTHGIARNKWVKINDLTHVKLSGF